MAENLFENPHIIHNISANKCLIDPPRSGAKEIATTLDAEKTERLVYVSCNSQTFFRDCDILQDRGFKLESIQLFDMFPQTRHVELLATFTGKN